MQIKSITLYRISLPFSLQFSHALRKRTSVKNIIVKVDAGPGNIRGYGEGAPRSFVTGETQESTVKSISRLVRQDHFPWNLEDISQIWAFIDSLSIVKTHNAAVCALETALLDAFGKCRGNNIIDYFPDDFATDTVYYGVALPLSGKQTTMELCSRSLKMNIRKLKLKMGKDFAQNRENFEAVREVFGEDYDLKVDVNGVWDGALALRHESLLIDYKVIVVEQPMWPDAPDLSHFANLMQNAGIILMADESACDLSEVKKIAKEDHYKMINVRLSKCGGFRNSLKMIDYIRRHRLSFQVGCHLGESGILSAAGRILCLLCNDAMYYDGSYDDYLLEKNVTLENVTFGAGGKAKPLNGPGLGIEVGSQNLSSLSDGPPVVIKRP